MRARNTDRVATKPLISPTRKTMLLAVPLLVIMSLAVMFLSNATGHTSSGSPRSGGDQGVPIAPDPDPTGYFITTSDGRIFDPAGKEFVPLGANVGIAGVFDWGGTAAGHSDTALEWGWNTVRLNILVADAIEWSRVRQIGPEAFMTEVDEFVREYTDKNIVVILDSHDLFMTPGGKNGIDAPYFDQIAEFWATAGAMYKDNPYVWFNLHNEPPVLNEKWVELNRVTAKVVRDTGARNPIVIDAPVWGQDLGPVTPEFDGAWLAHDERMAPAINAEFGNVILSQHNYGSFDIYTDPARYAAYVDRVRAAGLPLIVGEFGARTDGVDEWPLQFEHNMAAVRTVTDTYRNKGVGALWWHANHTDGWSLFRDDTSFTTHEPGTMLSEGGKIMWDLASGRRSAPMG